MKKRDRVVALKYKLLFAGREEPAFNNKHLAKTSEYKFLYVHTCRKKNIINDFNITLRFYNRITCILHYLSICYINARFLYLCLFRNGMIWTWGGTHRISAGSKIYEYHHTDYGNQTSLCTTGTYTKHNYVPIYKHNRSLLMNLSKNARTKDKSEIMSNTNQAQLSSKMVCWIA